jgi:hypothetical protein
LRHKFVTLTNLCLNYCSTNALMPAFLQQLQLGSFALVMRERDDIAFHPSSLGLYRLPHQLLYVHSRFEKRRVTLADTSKRRVTLADN